MQALAEATRIESAVLESARTCAALRAIESELGSGSLFNDPYARILAGESAIRKAREKLLSRPNSRIPIRTRWFDDFINEQFVRHRFPQLVLLGAGFDVRPFRLESVSSAITFQIDAGPVLDAKRDALCRVDPPLRLFARDLRSISADLSFDDWGSQLLEAGFDNTLPTMWIIEGVLYYLEHDAVFSVFQRIASLSANASQIAFSATTRPSRATQGLASYFKSSMPDPASFLKQFSFAVDTVDIYGGPRANFGRCRPDDCHQEDDWKHDRATIYVAATKH